MQHEPACVGVESPSPSPSAPPMPLENDTAETEMISFKKPIEISDYNDEQRSNIWHQTLGILRSDVTFNERMIAYSTAYDIAEHAGNEGARLIILKLLSNYTSSVFLKSNKSHSHAEIASFLHSLQITQDVVLVTEDLFSCVLQTLMSIVLNVYIRQELNSGTSDDKIRLGTNELMLQVMEVIEDDDQLAMQTAWFVNCGMITRQLYSNVANRIVEIRNLSSSSSIPSSSSSTSSSVSALAQLETMVVPSTPLTSSSRVKAKAKAIPT